MTTWRSYMQILMRENIGANQYKKITMMLNTKE